MTAGYAIFPATEWGRLPIALLVLGVLWFLARRDSSTFFSLASANRGVSVGAVVGVFLLALLAEMGLGVFFDMFAPQQVAAVTSSGSVSSTDFALSLLTIGLLFPFCEEYIFRWAVLRAFVKVRSPLFAVLFSASLFALAHGSLVYAAMVFPVGFMLGLLVLKTGQFWSAVLVHAALNIYVVVIQFVTAPSQVEPTEIAATPWSMGVAGLVVALGALFLAVRWLGLPSRRVEVRGRLWSGSLVAYVLIVVASSILVTISV